MKRVNVLMGLTAAAGGGRSGSGAASDGGDDNDDARGVLSPARARVRGNACAVTPRSLNFTRFQPSVYNPNPQSAGATAGLYKLVQVDPPRLKAPGFNI